MKFRKNAENSANRYSKGKVLPPVIIAAGVLFLVLPMIIKAVAAGSYTYVNSLMFDVFMYAGLAAAWNIIGGFGRQTSMAHASFIAIGAYTTLLLYKNFNISPLLGIFLALLISIAFAIAIGLPSFRLTGVYFVLATIATCQIVRQILLVAQKITNGSAGLMLKKTKENDFLNLKFTSNIYFYYVMLFVMALCFAVMIYINRNKLGYYLRAISQKQVAAESLGINATKYKMIAFVISGMLCTIIGMVYAFKTQYIDPDAVASSDLSTKIVLICIVGGLGSEWGPLLGSLIIIPILQVLNTYFSTYFNGGLAQTLYGAVLVLLILFLPNGFISIKEVIKDKRMARRLNAGSAKKVNVR